MVLRDLCTTIPFEQLPSEEDPGYPHQPSLDAFVASATKCYLCRLILDAVNESRDEIDNEQKEKPKAK
jgi:hypothetical protein